MNWFTSRETKEKKRNFMHLFALAHSDGYMDENERQMLIKMGQKWGLSTKDMSEAINNPQAIEHLKPKNLDSGVKQMIDLVEMMLVDGQISEREYQYLIKVAPEYQIPEHAAQKVVDKITHELIEVRKHNHLMRSDVLIHEIKQMVNVL